MLLTVHARPNAKCTKIDEVLDATTVKISVAAPAKEGKANRELVRFMSQLVKVPQSQIEIAHGTQTRIKQIKISGLSAEMTKNLFKNF
jgi:uncharacterized protein (TIGR00251 family)